MFRRLSNKLAPRFQKCYTSISQASVGPFVKTEKSDSNISISSLDAKKNCEASLHAILYDGQISKTKSDRTLLYKKAFSMDSLLVAYDQIKLLPRNSNLIRNEEAVQKINLT
jgi:hypothetical protein